MTSVWLKRGLETGCLVVITGLTFGCALETAAIGAPNVEVTDTPEVRPTPRKDASTDRSKPPTTAGETRDETTSGSTRDGAVAAPPTQTAPRAGVDPGPDGEADDAGADDAARDAGADEPLHAEDAGPTRPEEPATDPWRVGPYTPATSAGDGATTVFYPTGNDSDARRHPILIWDNAAGVSGPASYQALLQHVASHGFVVVAAQAASVDGAEVRAALDWIEAEDTRVGSPYFGKLDTRKIAAAGHGLGSIATFAQATDPRLATTLHLSGATNKVIGNGYVASERLTRPAAFFCDPGGGNIFRSGDLEGSCQADFDRATSPIFFATVGGADQFNLPVSVEGAMVGWLRWQLLGDATLKALFAAPSCTLCSRPNWSVQQRGLAALP